MLHQKKSGKHIFRYRYKGPNPHIRVANVSVSYWPIYVIMGLLDLSTQCKLVLATSSDTWSYNTHQVVPLSRVYNEELKVKQNCCQRSTLWASVCIFRFILWLSGISRYGSFLHCWTVMTCTPLLSKGQKSDITF